jgi:nucleoside-diphosphate-sugar epimerase
MVTGHSGYIGTVMVPMLLRSGHEVIRLDSNLYERCTFGAGGDVAQVPSARMFVTSNRDLEGPDAIIHLAPCRMTPGNFQPELTYESIIAASVRLATLAKQVGLRACWPPRAATTGRLARRCSRTER